MPYIHPTARWELRSFACDAGELNFELTTIVNDYLKGMHRYGKFNEVIGVLECMKLELYRRMVAPYEDRKCAENGDVYDSVS